MTRTVRRKSSVFGWSFLLIGTFILSYETIGLAAACGSGIAVLFSSWLVRKTTDPFDFTRTTMNAFWFLSYLAMIFIPAFFVYADQEGPYRAAYVFAVESVLITVPLGWCLANHSFGYGKQETDAFFRRPIVDLPPDSRHLQKFLFLFVLAMLLTLFYLWEVRTIPLLYLFQNSGDYWVLLTLREESFKLLDSPLKYLYSVTRSLLYPFLVITSFGFYLRTRQRKWLVLFIASFASAIVYASLTLAKAPVAIIFLLLVVFIYLYRGGILSRRVIAAGLILILAFPVLVIVYAAPKEDIVNAQSVFLGIASRLFYLPAEVVYYYFELFPAQMPYLYGRSIDKFARLTGRAPFDTPNFVGQYAFPNQLETISANGAFIADANADFGMAGVLLGGVLTGIVMQSLHIYAVRRRKSITSLSLYSFLILAFWFLNSTSLPIVLASDGALLVFVITWWFDRPMGLKLKSVTS